jgi:hypothetical protein
MHRLEAGDLGVDVGKGRRAGLDARIRVERGGLGRWRREHRLPGHRRSVGRVLRENVVQDRRARAGQADDEDRLDDLLLRDLGESLAVVHVVETIDGMTEDSLLGDHPTDRVQPGLALERGEQTFQRFDERAAAQIL